MHLKCAKICAERERKVVIDMETLLLDGNSPEDVRRAGMILQSGGLAAIPTETVYGLAANALDETAVRRIYVTKGRPCDNPLIVHICDFSQLAPLVREVSEAARKLADTFWPGPLTIILPKSSVISSTVSGGLDTVAVRFPSHPVARAVIRAAGVPLAAPSANLSGQPSPTTFAHVRADLTGKVEALVDGGDCGVGVESTVVTLAGEVPLLLRPGGVTLSQLCSVLGRVDVDPAVLHRLETGKKAASPGMKYKHYAPKADVTLVDASPEKFADYVNLKPGCTALCFHEDVPFLHVPYLDCGSRYNGGEQAHRLFTLLHRLDEQGAEKVYAHAPSQKGVGLAVYNRLIRAAGFQLVRLAPMVLGLTGPSGGGKSTAAEVLRQAGWAVVDCDALTHSPAVYDDACIRELWEAFGKGIAPNGILDRRALARAAFSSPECHKKLEEITFPRIVRAVRLQLNQAATMGFEAVALDAPTLFESGLDSACTRILAVTAPEQERLARLRKRDGLTDEQAAQRFSAQHPDEFYVDRADYEIENRVGTDFSKALAPVLQELEGAGEWKEFRENI